MEYIPAEIVLEIIKHLKRSSLRCIVQFKCSKYKRFRKLCDEHRDKLLKLHAQNALAAKNLRAVNKCFSDAYQPLHITLDIGGSFGTSQHREIIIINTKMCYQTLKQIHNYCTTENTIKEYKYNHRNNARCYAIKRLYDYMRIDTSLIFNNEKMEHLIQTEIKKMRKRNGTCVWINFTSIAETFPSKKVYGLLPIRGKHLTIKPYPGLNH
jgi:hypothetical protein